MNTLIKRLLIAILLYIPLVASHAEGEDKIVANVDTLWTSGYPGPLLSLSDIAVPLVSGSEVTATSPSLVALANSIGQGRVVAFGHEGFVSNNDIVFFDNLTLSTNAFEWLDHRLRRTAIFTTGHKEYTGRNTTVLHNRLRELGFTVKFVDGKVDKNILRDAGVVFIGNASGTFTQDELDALNEFLQEGGGLFLMGLGWPWEPYNPGMRLDDYPMNKIGAFCGVRWIDGVISDPVHNYKGSPLFLRFYPNIQLQTIAGAQSFLNTTTSAHAANLPAALQADLNLWARYVNALTFLRKAVAELGLPEQKRLEIYTFYLNLVTACPQYFRKGVTYAPATENAMAWIRELLHKCIQEALPLTLNVKNEIATTLGLTGRYLDLWMDFSLMLSDNSALNEAQLDLIYTYLDKLPRELHNLRSISVSDFLGKNLLHIALGGIGGSVNIFGDEIGICQENSFPNDVRASLIDCFSVVVAHEINHVVKGYYIDGDAFLKARHDILIAEAGEEPLNYLRSMIDRGFFVNAPQEFFASTANQWFDDSWKTVELGIVRFQNGFSHPIDQSLFFADVYSLGSNRTLFYRIDTHASLKRASVPLSRDANGRIIKLEVSDTLAYEFKRNLAGEITNIIVLGAPSNIEQIEAGQSFKYRLDQNYPNPFNPSTKINYDLPIRSSVRLVIYDVVGRQVDDYVALEEAGVHQFTWQPVGAGGIYFCRIEASPLTGDGKPYRSTIKMTFAK